LAGATPEQPDQSTLTAQLLRNTGIKFNCFNTHLDAALEGHLQQNFAPNKLPLLFADGKLVGGYE
jgi:glutaredoxin